MTPKTTKSAIDKAVTPSNVGFVLDESGKQWKIADTSFKYYKIIGNPLGATHYSADFRYGYACNGQNIDVYDITTWTLSTTAKLPSSATPSGVTETLIVYLDSKTLITRHYNPSSSVGEHRVWTIGSNGVPTYSFGFSLNYGSHGVYMNGMLGVRASPVENPRYLYMHGGYDFANIYRLDKQLQTVTALTSYGSTSNTYPSAPIPNGSDGCLFILNSKLYSYVDGTATSMTYKSTIPASSSYTAPYNTQYFWVLAPDNKYYRYNISGSLNGTFNALSASSQHTLCATEDGTIVEKTRTISPISGVAYTALLYESANPTAIPLWSGDNPRGGAQVKPGLVFAYASTAGNLYKVKEVIVGVLASE